MFFIKTIKSKFDRLTKIYEGTIYQISDNNNNFLTSGNYMNKADKELDILFKRPFFTDLYVKEISSGKRIPTFVIHKFLRLPVHTFVLVSRKGKKFNENVVSKSQAVEYKKKNKKEELSYIFKKGRTKRSTSKLSPWFYLNPDNKVLEKVVEKSKSIFSTVTTKLSGIKNTIFNKFKKSNNNDKIINEVQDKKENNTTENNVENKTAKTEKKVEVEDATIDKEEMVEENPVVENNRVISLEEAINDFKNNKLDLTSISTKNLIKLRDELISLKKNNDKSVESKNTTIPQQMKKSEKIGAVAKLLLDKKQQGIIETVIYDGVQLSNSDLTTEEDLLSYYMYKKFEQPAYLTENARILLEKENNEAKELKK